jgi:hypothetical protein
MAYLESGQTFTQRPLKQAIEVATVWARKAAELDPQDADVLVALGMVGHSLSESSERS